MVNAKVPYRPIIAYRPIRPSDLTVLEKIHGDLFPIRYEPEFFHNVVNGCGIVSWGAVDHSQPNAQSDELVGFVTARVVPAKDSECLRRLYNFYYINGQHYDSYLFVYYVNGARSPCSPIELVTGLVAYVKSGFKSMAGKLWKNEDRKISRWSKCKESGSLLPTVQNKRILTAEGCRSQFV